MLHQSKLKLRNVALFGAPGVGKGTYGKLISREFKHPVFSMGDYFRDVISKGQTGDAFVTKLRETLRSGQYVDDAMVLEVIRRVRFESFKDEQVVLLDGVPRTIAQAEALQREMGIDLVFNFTTPYDVILDKLMGRRLCPVCSRNYNLASIDRNGYFLKPMLPKISKDNCEDCVDGKTVKLVSREDDVETVIKARMDKYHESTEPILNFLE